MKTQGKDSHPRVTERGLSRSQPWPQTFGPQNCEEVNFCSVRPRICSILFWWLQQMTTKYRWQNPLSALLVTYLSMPFPVPSAFFWLILSKTTRTFEDNRIKILRWEKVYLEKHPHLLEFPIKGICCWSRAWPTSKGPTGSAKVFSLGI